MTEFDDAQARGEAIERTRVQEWERWEGRKLRLAIVCHCGEIFPMFQADQARAHVASHETETP